MRSFLNRKRLSYFILQEIPDLFYNLKCSNMQVYIRRWYIICMRKISVRNEIIKDILKKKNDVHWISVQTIVRTVVIFLIFNFNSSYTKGFSFILLPTWLLNSVSVFPTGEHASLQIYQQRLSVRNVHSALMHTKLLFPGKRSRFNERRTDANLRAFVAIIADIQSWQNSDTCTQPRARAHSRNGNLATLILIPTLPKPTAYFSFISSWRLLNQKNARVCATWKTSTQCPCIYFYHWIRAWWNHMGWCLSQMWSAKAQESLRFCAILSGSRCSLTQSF